MLCSTTRNVRALAVQVADDLDDPVDQRRLTPPAGSSSRIIFGLEHQPCASSTQLLLAVGHAPACWSPTAEADEVEQPGPAPPRAADRVLAISPQLAVGSGDSTFSRTVMLGNRREIWKRAAEPGARDPRRGMLVDPRAVEPDLAAVASGIVAGDQVEERRLARAVRSDQRGDRAGADGQVDAVDGACRPPKLFLAPRISSSGVVALPPPARPPAPSGARRRSASRGGHAGSSVHSTCCGAARRRASRARDGGEQPRGRKRTTRTRARAQDEQRLSVPPP